MTNVRPIDANALSEQFGNDKFRRLCKDWSVIDCLHLAHEEINSAPTLDYAPIVHAHWGTTYCDAIQDRESWLHTCSNPKCKVRSLSESEIPIWKYCPHCGAKMDEHIKEDDYQNDN